MRDFGVFTDRRVVIVVGGDAEHMHGLSLAFREQGVAAEAVADPEDAIGRIFDRDVLLTCVPIEAPAWSAFDILSLIRSHEQSGSGIGAPVVAVGPHCCAERRARALAAGFIACVAGGPVRPHQLDETLLRVRTLHPYLQRNIDSEDRDSIVVHFAETSRPRGTGVRDAIFGLALAIESAGIELLQQSLMAAYQGKVREAAGLAIRLGTIARGIGAIRLATLSDAMVASLDGRTDSIERSVILARVEMDRVVHTLREEALQLFPS